MCRSVTVSVRIGTLTWEREMPEWIVEDARDLDLAIKTEFGDLVNQEREDIVAAARDPGDRWRVA